MSKNYRAEDLAYRLEINNNILQRQIEGLTDADLLLQPESRGNCFNWVLGHIVNSRNGILKALGAEVVWDEEKDALYGRESAPITGADDPHLPMVELLEAHRISGERIVQRLESITDEELDVMRNERTSVWRWVSFLVWHDAYHTGQFEYLRQLSGIDDKVI